MTLAALIEEEFGLRIAASDVPRLTSFRAVLDRLSE
jgi:hypothetical protein